MPGSMGDCAIQPWRGTSRWTYFSVPDENISLARV
jgi:hypothetical protein